MVDSCQPCEHGPLPSDLRENSDMDSSSADSASSASLTCSRFEQLIIAFPPIFDNVLLHLPTSSLFDLYHTSRSIQYFLQDYPTAWKNLSFRLLPPSPPTQSTAYSASGFDSPDHGHDSNRKRFSLDLLLRSIQPYSNRLVSLDLDNTSVSGTELHARVLDPRRSTLQHLSVRGCREVSLKYHILPFLQLNTSTSARTFNNEPFALKSLYTYRCRHHRRRPYLPSSLIRRDCDSQATHQLVELCHSLGIWTDTAWCPTPATRCGRRQDYYSGRGGTVIEVWVPFDRLWRSSNYVGVVDDLTSSSEHRQRSPPPRRKGCLWENSEYGHAGEALGMGEDGLQNGKDVPMHLRRSHRIFVENFKCDACGERILERCEHCSIRMHCTGCRRTLCPSCAFNTPIRKKRRRNDTSNTWSTASTLPSSHDSIRSHPRKRTDGSPRDLFWWAPGAVRSPNLLAETSTTSQSSSDEDDTTDEGHTPHTNNLGRPKLETYWCCQKPTFSAGGSISYNGPLCGDNLKAAPLPHGNGFEDIDFVQPGANQANQCSSQADASIGDESSTTDSVASDSHANDQISAESFDIVPYLERSDDPASTLCRRSMSPRNLCNNCYYNTQDWRLLCAHCRKMICIEHEVKTLKARRCGFQNLYVHWSRLKTTGRALSVGSTVVKFVSEANIPIFYHKWRAIVERMELQDDIRREAGKWVPSKKGSPRLVDHTFETESGDSSAKTTSMFFDVNTRVAPPGVADIDLSSKRARPGTRQRSHSTSPVPYTSTLMYDTDMNSSTEDDEAKLLGPNYFWMGCARYFCPYPRNATDPRPSCGGALDPLVTCSRCNIYVCLGCAAAAGKQCVCSVCKSKGFFCPNCQRADDVLAACRWEVEEQERIKRELKLQVEKLKEQARVKQEWIDSRSERDACDELASGLAEFFGGAVAVG